MAESGVLKGLHGGACRPSAMGRGGVVASAHWLASLAGARVLMDGGNAVDAAVATAATLNVVEPYMSGLGGGGYMLVHEARTGQLHALDFIGRSAHAARGELFATQEDLYTGPRTPLVPGMLGGWLAALERFGSMDRDRVFAPAIRYAEDGFPISFCNADIMGESATRVAGFPATAELFLPGGRAPRPGSLLMQRDLARTYRQIVEGGTEVFYRGEIGRAIVRTVQGQSGFLTEQDLADYEPQWQEPLGTSYREHQVYTVRPPCSGLQYLETLKILEGFDLAALGHLSAAHLHLFLEAAKLASADRAQFAQDPQAPIAELLSEEYAARQRERIDRQRAAISGGERYTPAKMPGEVLPGLSPERIHEHTTHFDVVDARGNAVSVTQSLGGGFGSCVLAADTGIVLNDLSYWFDVSPASPNYLEGHRKIEMPMSPCLVFRDGRLLLAIGTPGGHGILQTTPQMITNVLDFGLNVQAAIEAPRVRAYERTIVEVEERIPAETRAALADRGHELRPVGHWSRHVGGGQGILVDQETGVLMGGSDPRRDGYAIAL